MRAFSEAIVVLSVSLAITLLVLGAIFVKHPLGAETFAPIAPVVSPAVFIEGSHDRPGSAAKPMHPTSTDGIDLKSCPFLAGLAAATGCPATPENLVANRCPYLREIYRQYVEAPAQPDPALGQDT